MYRCIAMMQSVERFTFVTSYFHLEVHECVILHYYRKTVNFVVYNDRTTNTNLQPFIDLYCTCVHFLQFWLKYTLRVLIFAICTMHVRGYGKRSTNSNEFMEQKFWRFPTKAIMIDTCTSTCVNVKKYIKGDLKAATKVHCKMLRQPFSNSYQLGVKELWQ